MDERLQLMSVTEAAEAMRCSAAHVYDLLRTGRLRASRPIRRSSWRIAAGELARHLGLPRPGSAYRPTDLLDLPGLIALLGYCDRRLRDELTTGRLPGRRVGRRWLVPSRTTFGGPACTECRSVRDFACQSIGLPARVHEHDECSASSLVDLAHISHDLPPAWRDCR